MGCERRDAERYASLCVCAGLGRNDLDERKKRRTWPHCCRLWLAQLVFGCAMCALAQGGRNDGDADNKRMKGIYAVERTTNFGRISYLALRGGAQVVAAAVVADAPGVYQYTYVCST